MFRRALLVLLLTLSALSASADCPLELRSYEDLRSTKTAAGSRLLFIEGLGLADWQEGELPGSRDHPVGDVVWKLAGCKE